MKGDKQPSITISAEAFDAFFDNFDFEAYYAKKRLRKDRPWAYDIVRVLLPRQSGLRLQDIYLHVQHLRERSGLPHPSEFEATIRSTLYEHASQSPKWNRNPGDDLFHSERRGIWMARRATAAAWLKRHEASIIEPEAHAEPSPTPERSAL